MKHDHHTAPRYYLSAFSLPDEPAFIWEYRRGTPYNPGPPGKGRNPVKRALKKASVKTDYYGRYEDDLAQREEAAKPVLEKLRATPIANKQALLTSAEKAVLTDYIGLFMKRTTAREERLESVWKTVRPQENIKLERAITILMNQGDFAAARRLRDEKRTYEQGVPEDLRQRSTIELYHLVRNRLLQLPWTFITTPEPALLTSDNPVRWPEHEGLAHDHAFLTFPIATTMTLLVATHSFANIFPLPTSTIDCGVVTATAEHIATLNHLTITGAHNYLYSHHASENTARSFG